MQATTSSKKTNSILRASRFSSGSSDTAACAAISCWSLGKSTRDELKFLSGRSCLEMFFFTASLSLSLTLVDVQEGVTQPAAENRFRKVPEVLLDQVGHVEGRLVVKGDTVRVQIHPFAQDLDAGFVARLPEQTHLVGHDTGNQLIIWEVIFFGRLLEFSHLVQTFISQVEERPLDAGGKRLACLLGVDQQRDAKDTASLYLHQLGLSGHFWDSPEGSKQDTLVANG